MGISWTTMDAPLIDVKVVDPSDTAHPVWPAEGPGDAPVLVLAHGDTGGDALEVTGTLDDLDALARRIHRTVRAANRKARRDATTGGTGRRVTIEAPGGQSHRG